MKKVLFMQNTVNKLAEKLQIEGEKTMEIFRSFQSEDWDRLIYSDGADWKVRNILAHFVVTEIYIPNLIRDILQGGQGVSENFDLDLFNQAKVSELVDLSPGELLELFISSRAETIQLVLHLSNSDLTKQGRHPFLGITNLEEIIQLIYRHTQIHQRDLRRILS
jgi:hypothetical protein